MSQAITKRSKKSRCEVVPQPSPMIDKVPPEIMMEIFKLVVLSSEEARSHGVKAICPVNQRWNRIANVTPSLWTKVTLAYPLHPDQLSAARKWLKASGQKAIDLGVDLCDPTWVYSDPMSAIFHPLADPTKLQSWQDTIAVVRGSEHRWRSFSIRSDIREPVYEFRQALVIRSLPLLESISFEHYERSAGIFLWTIGSPPLFGDTDTLMPNLREVSLSAVEMDWTLAATSFRDLRKLEIKNEYSEVNLAYGQLAALLAASPRLETLDITGYRPYSHPTTPKTSLVHLPALKHFTFRWGCSPSSTCHLLTALQIPETLETLSLVGAGSEDSAEILKCLVDLQPEDSGDKDPSIPWISMRGLKSLSVSCTNPDFDAVINFMMEVPMTELEEIRLACVDPGVLKRIAALVGGSPWSLKRFYIGHIRKGGRRWDETRPAIDSLRNSGLQVTIG